MTLTLQSPVSHMRGVGESRAAALANLGIYTVSDLLSHYPRGYQLRGNVKTVAEAADKTERLGDTLPVSLLLTVSAEPSFRMIRRGMSILRFRAFDETGVCEITYFNQNFLKNTFHTGGTFRFFGKVTKEGKTLKMASPIWEPVLPDKPLPGIVPVYRTTSGLSQKVLSGLIRDAMTALSSQIVETLPSAVMERASLCTLPYAVRNMHAPENGEALARARRRVLFEEYFRLGVLLAAGRPSDGEPAARLTDTDITPLLEKLPYTLTGAQKRAVTEIAGDLSSGFRMNRLLLGDVGSGKTVVAAAAAYIAAKNGFQTAIMAPTEILAVQHARELAPLLSALGLSTVLLTGSLTAAEKRRLHAEVAGGADIVIGTHALISETLRFARLGLVIEDEQHRFGVSQRASLLEKGERVHSLTMSATPIPRSLSLVAFGGLAVSQLDELPPGRQPVDTFVVDESYRQRLNGFIRRQVEEGHQVYIVCPSVEENPEKKGKVSDDPEELADLFMDVSLDFSEEKPPLKAAVEFARYLQEEALPGVSVAFVHGRMKTVDKDRVMRAFAEGEISVLVSTTVIEVGVNVPNATLMIVENAERFGLAQLHQLRGRVGRGRAKSFCVLVSDAKGETAKRRLEVLRRCSDGYRIAEEDLKLRGPGEFIGDGGAVRQHGNFHLPIPSREGDMELLNEAMEEARRVILTDPELAFPDHKGLRNAVGDLRRKMTNQMT